MLTFTKNNKKEIYICYTYIFPLIHTLKCLLTYRKYLSCLIAIIVRTLIRLIGELMRVGCQIPHPPGMKEEKFKSKMDTLQLNGGIFRPLSFKVRKNFKVEYAPVRTFSERVTSWEV